MRFAVVGRPVGHSRSPAIHTAAFRALDIDATYEAIDVPDHGFERVVDDLRSRRLDGVNVTMPHKDRAFEAADRVTDEAHRTAAVNTLVVRDGAIVGHNTDVDGVRHAVASLGPALRDLPASMRRFVVLGTGGAARAAVVALGTATAVMGRNAERAADALRITGSRGELLPWGVPIDGAILVNATPVGMRGEQLPEPLLASASALIDMVYADAPTASIAWAEDHGLPYADGLTMLVGQAAAAFRVFVDRPAPIAAMERAARTGP